jgi:hypothetical protein
MDTEPLLSEDDLLSHWRSVHGSAPPPAPPPPLPPQTAGAGATPGSLLGNTGQGGLSGVLAVVDDTMHLRSMRLACYRIAAEEGAAFVCVHVAAPSLADLLVRNARRVGAQRVPEASLRKVVAELEPPDPGRVYWERDSLRIVCSAGADGGDPRGGGTVDGYAHRSYTLSTWSTTAGGATTGWTTPSMLASGAPPPASGQDRQPDTAPRFALQEVWREILRLWARRPLPAQVEADRAAAAAAAVAAQRTAQTETAASLLHAVDIQLRELVAATMKRAAAGAAGRSGPSRRQATAEVKQMAGLANKCRKAVLAEAKAKVAAAEAAAPSSLGRAELLAWVVARFNDAMDAPQNGCSHR